MDPSAPAATAARAIGAALFRHVLTAAGTALVAHGFVDQDTATSAVGPIAEQLLGLTVTIGAASWSALRARLSHTRWADAWHALTAPAPEVQQGEHP